MRAKRSRIGEVALSLGQERRRFDGIILLGRRRNFPTEEFVPGDLKVVRDAGKSAILQVGTIGKLFHGWSAWG